jgi:hypothetical protein
MEWSEVARLDASHLCDRAMSGRDGDTSSLDEKNGVFRCETRNLFRYKIMGSLEKCGDGSGGVASDKERTNNQTYHCGNLVTKKSSMQRDVMINNREALQTVLTSR